MTTAICNVCHGRGGPIEIECPDCGGTGYDLADEKPYAQCHTCYGDQTVEVEDCTTCGGTGEVDVDADDNDNAKDDSDELDDVDDQ